MPEFFKTGRYLLAIAIIGFGLTQFVAGHFMAGFFPVSETISSKAFFLYFTSTLFVFAGLAIFFDRTAKHGALIAATVFLAGFVFIHLLRLIKDPHNGGYWTTFAEMLAYCGGTYILLSKLSGYTEEKAFFAEYHQQKICRNVFVCSLADHFRYSAFYVCRLYRNINSALDSLSCVLGVFCRHCFFCRRR